MELYNFAHVTLQWRVENPADSVANTTGHRLLSVNSCSCSRFSILQLDIWLPASRAVTGRPQKISLSHAVKFFPAASSRISNQTVKNFASGHPSHLLHLLTTLRLVLEVSKLVNSGDPHSTGPVPNHGNGGRRAKVCDSRGILQRRDCLRFPPRVSN